MSRSNHYRICEECTQDETCWRHTSTVYWGRSYIHKPIREIAARRTWKRKQRYPKYSVKSFRSAPPRWWWQEQHSRARAVYRQILRDEDPVLPPEKKLIDLWDWY
jgi:hypothetical protein